MNLGNWLSRQAQIDPTRPALFAGHDLVADYGTFHTRAARLAFWLGKRGIVEGDRVAIFMKNCPEYLIVLYGVWYAGAVAVPVNAKLHGKEAAFIIGDAGAVMVFATDRSIVGLLEAQSQCQLVDVGGPEFEEAMQVEPLFAPRERAPEDLAWLFYTSGTTGQPKGVMITHRMLATMSLTYPVDVDTVSGSDATIYAAPMSHGAGIYNMIHVLKGSRHVCPKSGGFDEAEIFALARHYGRAQLFAAPTMVKRLTNAAIRAGESGEGLRTIVYAGGPMYLADIIEAEKHFGSIFVQIYGQGECPMGITALSRQDVSDRDHPRWQHRLASVGRAQSPVEVRIGDANGAPVTDGVTGEIMVRGDVVMPGYWRNPEATAKTLVNGWLLTGDMGFMDADDYVTLQDRSKDMIITGGSNVYPREVEEVLLTHPDVREVSVIGQPHPEWGEIVVACVVGDAKITELDQLCLDHIARFKRPKEYMFLSELPKNSYGKVLKTDLRAMLEE